ncbi:MAG: YncE family protein, partial [Chloroflexi bacterium]|nr:YncE family protein [Chloroflexota bacterium]
MMRQPRWIGLAVLLGGLGGGLIVTVTTRRPASAFTGTIPVGFGPQQVALDRRTGYAFVTNSDDHTVSLLDSRRGVVRRTIAVTGAPLDVAVDASTRRAFVVTDAGIVQVFDTENGALLRSVTIGVGFLSLCALAVDEHLGRVVITMGTGDTPSILTVLDAGTGIILRQMTVGRYAHSVAVDERSGRAVVTNSTGTTVTLVDLSRPRVLRTVVLPWHPLAVAIDALTGHAFVTGPAAGAVAMLDDNSGAVLRLIAIQGGAQEVAAASGRAVVITGTGGTATGAT